MRDGAGGGEGGRPRVVRGEGGVGLRVPVLGRELEGEGEGEQGVYGGEDGAAVWDGEGAGLGRLVSVVSRFSGYCLDGVRVLAEERRGCLLGGKSPPGRRRR